LQRKADCRALPRPLNVDHLGTPQADLGVVRWRKVFVSKRRRMTDMFLSYHPRTVSPPLSLFFSNQVTFLLFAVNQTHASCPHPKGLAGCIECTGTPANHGLCHQTTAPLKGSEHGAHAHQQPLTMNAVTKQPQH
jgi:hypothetical protein